MPHRLPPDPQVHLHWVQETPSRALVLPVSQTLDSPSALPPSIQTAIRATGLPSVELHLPPYRPALDPDQDEWFAGLRFHQSAVGRLTATHAGDAEPLATMAFHQAMVLTFRAITGDTTPLTLLAEAPPSPLLPQPMASRHVCQPRGGLTAAPSERSHHYDRAYKGLAIAVQTALRQTVPAAHLSAIGQLADRPHVHSLLFWSAAGPVVGRCVDQLGVDVLDRKLLQRAQASATRNFAPRLEEVWNILTRLRARPADREAYHPKRALRIADHCRQHARFVNLLFANELRLITALVRYCARIPAWRALGPPAAAQIYREARAAWEEIDSLSRSFYQRHPHTAIGSRLLLEAVRILEAID